LALPFPDLPTAPQSAGCNSQTVSCSSSRTGFSRPQWSQYGSKLWRVEPHCSRFENNSVARKAMPHRSNVGAVVTLFVAFRIATYRSRERFE